MPNLFLTLVIAFVFIVFAIALLAIGWLIKGKTKIEKTCSKETSKNDQCQDVCVPTKDTLHMENNTSVKNG